MAIYFFGGIDRRRQKHKYTDTNTHTETVQAIAALKPANDLVGQSQFQNYIIFFCFFC